MEPVNINFKELLRLDNTQIISAAELLTRAFLDYPLFRYFFPDISARKTLMPYLFRYSLSYAVRYGYVFATSPNMEGIAVWLHSDYHPMTFWRVIKSVPLSTILNLGMKGGSGMRYTSEYIDGVHRHLVPTRHWFLQDIGVDPSFRGNGYASRLLRPMLQKIDTDNLLCYLETQDEVNVAIYEHYGFQVIDKSTIPQTTLINWAMLRK